MQLLEVLGRGLQSQKRAHNVLYACQSVKVLWNSGKGRALVQVDVVTAKIGLLAYSLMASPPQDGGFCCDADNTLRIASRIYHLL